MDEYEWVLRWIEEQAYAAQNVSLAYPNEGPAYEQNKRQYDDATRVLAWLAAQPAPAQWRPVAGVRSLVFSSDEVEVKDDGATLYILTQEMEGDVTLPDTLRLCEFVPAQEGAQ